MDDGKQFVRPCCTQTKLPSPIHCTTPPWIYRNTSAWFTDVERSFLITMRFNWISSSVAAASLLAFSALPAAAQFEVECVPDQYKEVTVGSGTIMIREDTWSVTVGEVSTYDWSFEILRIVDGSSVIFGYYMFSYWGAETSASLTGGADAAVRATVTAGDAAGNTDSCSFLMMLWPRGTPLPTDEPVPAPQPTPEPVAPTPEPIVPTPEPVVPAWFQTPEPTPEAMAPTPGPVVPAWFQTPEPTPEAMAPTPEPVVPVWYQTPVPAAPTTPEPVVVPPTASPSTVPATPPPVNPPSAEPSAAPVSPAPTEEPTSSPIAVIPPTAQPASPPAE
ncbi:unnamed protein product, partial [Ectocarpus sp. 12 AP-2014]